VANRSSMGARPRVSVLLPVRNAAQTLEECFASIRAQTLRDFEVLVVDDGSSDGSAKLAGGCRARDPRFRLLHNPGAGLVAALNHGLRHARADLVARMDADDRMHPERLRLQSEHLGRHPEIALLGARVRVFPRAQIRAGYREYIRWQNRCLSPADIDAEIYVESPFTHPSVMFRRASVVRCGGYRNGRFPEDYELWLRLHRRGYSMAKLPRILLDWRESEQRTSRIDPRYSRDAFDRIRAAYLALDPRLQRGSSALAVWGAGRSTRKRVAHLLTYGYTVKTWIDVDPRKIGNRLQGTPVRGPDWLDRRPKPFVLGYVANHGARDQIQHRLQTLGYRRGEDYLMVG